MSHAIPFTAAPAPPAATARAAPTPPAPTPSAKFAPLPVTQMESDGSFRGYASLFNRVDLGRDRMLPGAFARSLRRRGPAGVRMLYQHDPSEVIGHWRAIREDAAGLYVEGVLSPDVARAREVRALMRAGALDGLSIGFHTVRARKDAGTGVRSIVEADLWEVSVVTFPMLPGARVSEVKSRPRLRPTIRDLERTLRRDAGLSRRAAKAALAHARMRDASDDPLAARIHRAADLFRS